MISLSEPLSWGFLLSIIWTGGWVGKWKVVIEFEHDLGRTYLYLSRKRSAWYHRSSVILGRSGKQKIHLNIKIVCFIREYRGIYIIN